MEIEGEAHELNIGRSEGSLCSTVPATPMLLLVLLRDPFFASFAVKLPLVPGLEHTA